MEDNLLSSRTFSFIVHFGQVHGEETMAFSLIIFNPPPPREGAGLRLDERRSWSHMKTLSLT